ncbi:MAG: hypothetical protein R3224_00130 [Balneolaceae bacterium]|nr:hypothetical protein [Balneolaceae bacterium]
MLFLIGALGIIFAGTFWFGYRQYLRLEHLNRKNLALSLIAAMALLTLLTLAHWIGLFPQEVAAPVTMGLYALAAGFFFGNGTKLIVQKRRAGMVEYMHRSFWIDIAPNLISALLVAYGIYRTGILTMGPFSGIGIASGLSLIGFGFFGWTVRIVPEFRNKGILILDQCIDWKNVLSYEWHTEGVLLIDYMAGSQKICEFSTAIPVEDQLRVERLLGRRIKEHEDERKNVLAQEEVE